MGYAVIYSIALSFIFLFCHHVVPAHYFDILYVRMCEQ
jgi:hypothetical protein